MPKSTIFITFQCSLASIADAQAVSAAADNVREQLLAAAEQIKQSGDVYKYIQATIPFEQQDQPQTVIAPEPVITPAAITVPPVDDNTEALVQQMMKNLRRTNKSVKIIRAFANNSGTDVSIEQLTNETGLSRNEVQTWLNQTAKKITGIINPTKGIYKFDPDKLHLTTNNK